MSYNMSAYLVRIDSINHMLFSADTDVKDRVALVPLQWPNFSRNAQLLAGVNESIRLAVDGPPEEFIRHDLALAALQALVQSEGHLLEGEGFEDFHLFMLDDLGAIGEHIKKERENPFKKLESASTKWSEYLGYITAAEADDLLPEVSRTVENWPQGGDLELFETFGMIEEWLTAAVDRQTDIVYFIS